MNKKNKNNVAGRIKARPADIRLKYSRPFVLWFTGLSGAGKSTLANRIYGYLKEKNIRVERLDGDAIRTVLPDLGFTKEERDNHIKYLGFLASMLERNGIVAIASFISPYRDARDLVRRLCTNFIEVYVKTPLEICERRDVKGLYKKARKGQIRNFTGVSDPYEGPARPEIVIETDGRSIEESFSVLRDYVDKYLAEKAS